MQSPSRPRGQRSHRAALRGGCSSDPKGRLHKKAVSMLCLSGGQTALFASGQVCRSRRQGSLGFAPSRASTRGDSAAANSSSPYTSSSRRGFIDPVLPILFPLPLFQTPVVLCGSLARAVAHLVARHTAHALGAYLTPIHAAAKTCNNVVYVSTRRLLVLDQVGEVLRQRPVHDVPQHTLLSRGRRPWRRSPFFRRTRLLSDYPSEVFSGQRRGEDRL